jgi:cation/acetate symporter
MGVNGWTWLVVAATFALFVAVAIWSKARSTAEYYVADRAVSPVVNGLATASDWMSAASVLSMAGLVATVGRDGAAYLMGWTGGYVLLAVLLAPYLRKYGKYTVPQFVGERYYSGGARLLALVLALLISFTYVVGQVRGVGVVLARFLDVSIEAGVLWAAVAVLLYTVLGGMKGITHAQVAQYAVIVVAFVLPAIAASERLTGNPVPPLALGSGLSAQGAAELGSAAGVPLLEAIDRISTDLGFAPYTSGWRPRQDVIAIAAVLMFGTAGLPHILVRFFTVPKIRDARATAAWALVFIAVLYLTAPAVAAFARAGLVSTLHGRAYAERPEWFQRWERTGLAAFVDRDGDGRMTLSAAPERNEVKVDPDVLVIAHAEIARVAPWILGLVAAGALAAGLSTAAGLLLVIASGVAHDVVRGGFAPRLGERAELYWARSVAGAAALLAALLALRPPGTVAEVVAFAFGLAASTFFPALVAGIFWRRATRAGAVAGMLAGFGLTFGYVGVFGWLDPSRARAGSWWLGISPEGIGALGLLVNLAILVVVSLATRPPPEPVQALVASLRYPREPRRR